MEVTVLGLGWRGGHRPGGLPARLMPRPLSLCILEPTRPARGIGGPPSLLMLGTPRQKLGAICPACPPPSSKHQISSRLPEIPPEPGASVGPPLLDPRFLSSLHKVSPLLHPEQGRDTRHLFRTWVRLAQSPPQGQSPQLLRRASLSTQSWAKGSECWCPHAFHLPCP